MLKIDQTNLRSLDTTDKAAAKIFGFQRFNEITTQGVLSLVALGSIAVLIYLLVALIFGVSDGGTDILMNILPLMFVILVVIIVTIFQLVMMSSSHALRTIPTILIFMALIPFVIMFGAILFFLIIIIPVLAYYGKLEIITVPLLAISGLTFLLASVLPYYFVIGSWAILCSSKKDKDLIRPTESARLFSRDLWLRCWGLPKFIEFIGAKKAICYPLFFLSYSLVGFAYYSPLLILNSIRNSIGVDESCVEKLFDIDASLGPWCSHSFSDFNQNILMFTVPISIFILIGLLLSSWIYRLATRIARTSLYDLQSEDKRAPILFLRSFQDDQVVLPKPKLPIIGRILDWGHGKKNLDHVLLEEGIPHGPVVAIGDPEDKRPPFGVARGYFEDVTWQEAVAQLIKDSNAVVVCLDDTEGVWWEVEYLASHHAGHEILFLMHPKYSTQSGAQDILKKVVDRFSAHNPVFRHAIDKENLKTGKTLGFFVGPNDSMCVAQSTNFSRFSYTHLLRWFLRSQSESVA